MEGVEDSTVADMGGLLEVAGDNVVVYGGTTVDSPVASPEESRKRQRSVELAQHEIELETGRKRKSVAEIRTSPSKKPRTSHSARRGTIATEAPTRPSPEIQIEQAQHRELEMQLNQLHKPSVSPPLPELSSRRRRSTVSRSPQPPVAPAPQHGPEIIVIPDEPEPLATVLETEQEGQEEDEAWSVTRLSPKSSATPGIGAEVEITPPLPPVPVPTEEEFETSPEAEIQPSGRDTVPAPKSKGKAPSAKRASGRAYVPEEEQRESEEEGDKQASVRSGKISKGNASSGKRASGQAYVPEEEPHETEDEADNPASVRSDKGSKGKGKGKARGGRVTKADTATKEAKPKTERKKRDKKIVPPPEISPSDGPVARRTRSRKKL